MSNKEKFIELILEIEKISKKYNNEANLANRIRKLKENRREPYLSNYEFLRFCIEYRNAISHEGMGRKYLDFTDNMIKDLEEIVYRAKNPFDVYTKSTKNIFSADIKENVKEIMRIMSDKNYTHIPIYKEGLLVGIFSESSLFTYLFNDEIVEISGDTTFEDIQNYIALENSEETIKFVSRNDLYDNVVNEFIKRFKNGEKLACIMVTQNGKNTEKVIGILTAWDIIGRD